MPIDHTAMNVTDIDRSRAFYSDALKPLGYSLVFEVG
jgi:catechol 2,3-dioxygenase-like lactoylglutathione lyase family enzyme